MAEYENGSRRVSKEMCEMSVKYNIKTEKKGSYGNCGYIRAPF